MDYDRIDAVNFSSLKNMSRGPAYYLHRKTTPLKQTPAMAKGTAIHCAVLEPEQFPARYAVLDIDRRTKAGKEQAQIEEEAGRTILKPAEYDEIKAISASVWANETAAKLLTGATTEAALTWELDGIKRKGRIDAYQADGSKPVLIDLKSTMDPQPWAFQRQTAKMHYHAQMAWYAEGLDAVLGKGYPDVYIIAVGNSAPYECVVYGVPVSVLSAGETLYEKWLEMLKQCERTNNWPGLYEDLQILQLPAWAENEQEEVDFSGLEME